MLVNKVMRLFRYGFSQFYVRQLCFFLLLGIVLKDLNELSKKLTTAAIACIYLINVAVSAFTNNESCHA